MQQDDSNSLIVSFIPTRRNTILMVNSLKGLVLSSVLAVIVLLAGCAAPATNPAPPAVQTPVQDMTVTVSPTASQPPAGQIPASVQVASDNGTPVAAQLPSPLSNRVEVIYSHMNQRCPTCLCFEERTNYVIATYFKDAIESGKLTYRVLNAQEPQTAPFFQKYKAVGSQLFLNTIVNGFDNIEDIQDIWNWDYRTDKSGFDLKVKNAIEQRLESLN